MSFVPIKRNWTPPKKPNLANVNLNKAVAYSLRLRGKMKGLCATGVKNTLAAGGWPYCTGDADKMHQICQIYGFTKIATIPNQADRGAAWTRANAKAGDVAVYFDAARPGHVGHVCFFNGRGWTSDGTQANMQVYGKVPEMRVYRYTGQSVDPGLIEQYSSQMNAGQTVGGDFSLSGGGFSGGGGGTFSGGGGGGNSSPFAYREQNPNYETVGSSVDTAVFTGAQDNAMSIAANVKFADKEHTRIYSTNSATMTISELAVNLDEKHV